MSLLTVATLLLGMKNESFCILAVQHATASSMNLKDILMRKKQARIKTFRQQHGKMVSGQITVNMKNDGMRSTKDWYMKHQFLILIIVSVFLRPWYA
uniref:Uncharacterized protein n=1 Tax=Theropithecus gelada TaxID=9565 RepID=A0A8D2EUI8_THEGE